ncbi:lysine biosynthesis protein LysW [Streptomyces tricolor]|nr:lysine biosynthesis protein LysW [Streptomyces tricolor]
MSSATLTGACPEVPRPDAVPPIVQGGRRSPAPECELTLRVEEIADGRLTLEMVEVQLRDWGQ